MEKQDVKPLWDKQALAALNDGQFGDAWEALIQAYEKDVLARCILWMGDKASGVEVAQEVFLKIRDALPDFRRESSFRRWIMGITANTCKQHITIIVRLKRILDYGTKKAIVEARQDLSASPEEFMIKQQQNERLHLALKKLRKKDRDLIMKYYFDGLTLQEIADQRSQGRETVRQELLIARQKLKRMLD